MTSSRTLRTSSRAWSSGWVTLVTVALSSAASSAILRVKGAASVARSSAFLKRAVAISSMVRVILRMLRTALRRLTRVRVLAMLLDLHDGPFMEADFVVFVQWRARFAAQAD